ncbi:M10 family metallopeptidase C-terminal domain-containing protein [Arvimicrobium flavum]|uniref:M10 family metallopeptidase C-terminal domain-containing protein n=1 Tax=Arvimicrobium flavum TaxID=3393320 RepID=UPI00237B1113|nr:M10 family metallopeptidase C-terminal domain-containing protein [Mesorhizobium shangrilense]
MTAAIKNTLTGDATVDGILLTNKWENPNITFSFPTKASNYGKNYSSAGEPYKGFEAFNSTQKAAVIRILDSIEGFTKATFTQMTETDTQHATLRFAETTAVYSSGHTSAWTYHPSSTTERAGDGWYNTSGANYGYNTPAYGNRSYATMMHEIGHQIGLAHPHDARGTLMPDAYDNRNYTVMSYERLSGGDVQTYMQKDIAALQHMYGANYDTNSGNTTYKWSTTTGELSINGVGQGKPTANKIAMTVWDGGGTDTYDFSNYATALKIDLNPGAWTSLGTQHIKGAEGEIANALLYKGDARSLIENAKGGSGADTIVGNQAANVLEGNAGNDILRGEAGNDILRGGTGSDKLYGGTGSDVFDFDFTSWSTPTARDTIMDFVPGVDDIDLRTIDANTKVSGDQAFSFIGKGAFTGAAGQLNFVNGVLSGDVNGDKVADFQVNVTGVSSLTAWDFIL